MSKSVKAVKQEVVVNQLNSAALSTKLSSAIAIRESWSANEQLKSNMKLYDILTRCYEVYDEYLRAEDKRQWKADFFDAICSINDNYKSYEVANKLTLTIVRVVFGYSDLCRKRVSTYAKVLRVAADNGSDKRVKASELAAWITERGGVQEISRSQDETTKAQIDKAEHVKKRLRTVANVEKFDNVNSVDLVGNFMLLLVSVDDKELTVKHVFDDVEYVNSAIRKLYSEYKEKEVVENKKVIDFKQAQTEVDQSTQQQINKLAA